MLVGGAMRASAGLVFARYEQTHRLVMVFPQGKTGALQRELLDTFGLAGASLTRLTMTNLHIKEDDILGLGRRGLQQGLNALSKVFERHRPMVAAMALGTTYGLLKALETRPLPVAAKTGSPVSGVNIMPSFSRCSHWHRDIIRVSSSMPKPAASN